MKALGLGLALAACLFTACAQQQAATTQPAPSPARAEAAIRQLDNSWAQAVAAKNAGQCASYYAPDAVFLAPGAPLASGREAIQKTWAGMMALPGFALTFAPDSIHVAAGADMAYELGHYTLTTKDANGRAHSSKASYVVVWRKQADGTWKAAVDAPTTTTVD